MIDSSKMILDLYNGSVKFKKSCAEQHKIFQHWTNHNSDPIYQAMGFDSETTGLTLGIPTYLHIGNNTDIKVNNPAIVGLSLAIPYEDKIALFWGRLGTDMYDEIVGILGVKGHKVAHNSKFDMRTLTTNGIRFAPTINCTLTMSRIYWDRMKKFSLDDLCEVICPELSGWKSDLQVVLTRLKRTYTKAGYPKEYVNYSFIPDDIISKYAMQDVFICYILNVRLRPEIDTIYPELYERERRITEIVSRMETRGMLFDTKMALAETTRCNIEIAKTMHRLSRMVGAEFKPTAKKTLACLLKMGVPEESLMKKGSLTTGKIVLEKLSETTEDKQIKKFTDSVLLYRSLSNTVGSYLRPLRIRALHSNGIIYYTINPSDTRTSRMAGRDPNLQDIPRPSTGAVGHNPIRACFRVRKGFLMFFLDYKQMEMALFGLLAGDKRILKAYANGEDLHSYMTTLITGVPEDHKTFSAERSKIKSINFGIIYGMGIGGLAQALKTTETKAVKFHDMYMNEFPLIGECQEKCALQLKDDGYVEDWFGKRYHMDFKQAYKAVNSLIQGGCAQVTKIAFIKIDEYIEDFERPAYILVPIHDEFLIEIKSTHPEENVDFVLHLKDYMENILQLAKHRFKFLVDCKWSDTNWEEKKSFENILAKTT